jgi:circadian clock protein KaiC
LLAQSSLRFRRQMLALKQFLLRHGCTVMLLDNLTIEVRDLQLHSLAHGVIVMERNAPVDGGVWRHLQVLKLRGISFYEGCHDFVVRTGGLEVFPRIRRTTAYHRVAHEVIPSGVEGLDSLLGGGLDRGTATLILGPTGTGKSSLTTLYATAFARRGERVASYVFDENLHTKLIRARSFGLDLEALQDQGWISLSQVNANETSPGELCHRVHQAVVQDGVRLVVIDGLNGYLHAPMQKDISAARMHDLLGHLGQQGVTTLLVVGQHGVLGSNVETPVDLSYMADTVLLLRYFEAAGLVRRAISVLKKRTGRHERTIRELWIGERGIEIGGALRDLHGVMTGVPSASAPEYASAWELDENGTG